MKAIDGIADEAIRKDAHEAIRGANASMVELAKAKGYDPGVDVANGEGTPLQKFNAKLEVFAKGLNKSPQMATGEFLSTTEGAELYQAVKRSNPAPQMAMHA